MAEKLDTAAWYRRFALVETRGYSPTYEQWCIGISEDPHLLALLDDLPDAKRQPNLLLGAARFHGAQPTPYPEFRGFLLEHWAQISETMLTRSTQTNEAGRCAVLLPLFARIAATEGRPLALLEVGASAGLCLYPDRYGYSYDAGPLLSAGPVPQELVMECATTGHPPLPASLPSVSFRGGIDLNPLRVADDDDVAWLEALVWPEHARRRERLRAAVEVARREPPLLVKGDLTVDLEHLIQRAPADAVVVVFHSAVLAYVGESGREAFRDTMLRLTADRSRPVHWVSNEGYGVLPGVEGALPKADVEVDRLFVLTHNGEAVARTGGHGQTLDWLE
ncbi:DUF2332 domain-containing protein [Arthrobacter sp. AET 35A]|uniref:DUF2332 domain-containing protein n=1 Tax=Arthrobacter sp. AET 35A TaxID=2292643 RepID=UPI00177F0875|nr:DUF2332 domain-containing protein [Arthrobacter sp. AET 35A]MBE0011386.1 DUF2332 domain-containing protein [Arthrobacter sp. AET 35A]